MCQMSITCRCLQCNVCCYSVWRVASPQHKYTLSGMFQHSLRRFLLYRLVRKTTTRIVDNVTSLFACFSLDLAIWFERKSTWNVFKIKARYYIDKRSHSIANLSIYIYICRQAELERTISNHDESQCNVSNVSTHLKSNVY